MATKRGAKVKEALISAPNEETVKSIKGFDADLKCRGFQFEVGKTYEHDGKVVACQSGFHAIEGHPLEVLRYYAPSCSRYADVTQSGKLARHDGDSKIASASITVDAEIHLPEIIRRAVKWVFDRANWKDGVSSAKKNGGVTASGDCGAATASGDCGAATASGYFGKVKGKEGCALFLVYREPGAPEIKHAWAGIAGRDGINADTFYRLDETGKPVEVS